VERLNGIGTWLRTNGEAIYGTTASPFPSLPWGRATVGRAAQPGRSRLYLHVFDVPANGVLEVPGLRNDVRGARVLGTAGALRVVRRGPDLAITLPGALPADTSAVVVVLDLAGEPDVAVPPSSLAPTRQEQGPVARESAAARREPVAVIRWSLSGGRF